MAWADKELQLSDNQLLDGAGQVWSTNVIGSNVLRDIGRGKPLWANLTVMNNPPAAAALFRFRIVLITTSSTPAAATGYLYSVLATSGTPDIRTMSQGMRICAPIAPVAPNLGDPGFDPAANDWNHAALGKRFIAALYEQVSILDGATVSGTFSQMRVSMDFSLQPTSGFRNLDQQYYPSGFRA